MTVCILTLIRLKTDNVEMRFVKCFRWRFTYQPLVVISNYPAVYRILPLFFNLEKCLKIHLRVYCIIWMTIHVFHYKVYVYSTCEIDIFGLWYKGIFVWKQRINNAICIVIIVIIIIIITIIVLFFFFRNTYYDGRLGRPVRFQSWFWCENT